MSTAEKFKAAAGAALCQFLSASGSAAASYAAYGLFTPGPFDEWAALGYAGVAGLAYQAGCSWDSGQAAPPGGIDGCREISGGIGAVQYFIYGEWRDVSNQNYAQDATRIVGVTVYEGGQGAGWVSACEWERAGTTNSSEVIYGQPSQGAAAAIKWRLRVKSGTCVSTGNPDVPPVPPYEYTDPGDGCNITVNFLGYMANDNGQTGVAWKLEPGPQSRASGGVIGGCNFEPVIYYQPPGGGGPGGPGGGGDGPIIPWVPGPDGEGGEPWWVEAIRKALPELAGEILRKLLEQRFSADVYRVVSVCEKDADGDPVSEAREWVIPQLTTWDAVVNRLDGIAYILQGLKDFKQPICDQERPPAVTGDPVTVTFRSDEQSPMGGTPLKKQFRYFDQSGSPLETHTAHWQDFVWQAGNVIVWLEGTALGSPKVWAASEAEGRRVIQHAAQVAGVDITKGKWHVTASSDARYGQPGRMRVAMSRQGTLWVTKRPDPSGPPETLPPVGALRVTV